MQETPSEVSKSVSDVEPDAHIAGVADKASEGSEEPQKRRIQIKVPDIAKKLDESCWEELESYIFTGFLTSQANVQNVNFVFKTLNYHEMRNIDFMKPNFTSSKQSKLIFQSMFIAYSIFMVNSSNAIYERPKNINKLIKTIAKLTPQIQDRIIENLAALNAKASRLSPLVEVYSYENRSRYKWLQIGHLPIHSHLTTGIAGTDDIGMNFCQQAWVAMNKIIDRKDDMEREWSNAKFIGSCFAGKGIRSIDERDKSRLEKERVDREELKMKVLYNYLNRVVGDEEEKAGTIILPDGRKAEVVHGSATDGKWRADSAEELAEQLSAALSGEKDHHDLVIEAKERELRERAVYIEQEMRKIHQRPGMNIDPNEAPELATGGTRVLGGKDMADAYLARMERLKLLQIEKSRRIFTPDQQDSDKSED